MNAWDDYVEWSGLDESMLAHPAGKGFPESAEVAQARMDAEAVMVANSGRLDEWHHSVSTRRYGRLLDVVGPLLIVAVIVGALFAVMLLGELAGGWTV